MKTHPIKPADYFYNSQIRLENQEYENLRTKFRENDEKALQETGSRRAIVDNEIKSCERAQAVTSGCPSWSRFNILC